MLSHPTSSHLESKSFKIMVQNWVQKTLGYSYNLKFYKQWPNLYGSKLQNLGMPNSDAWYTFDNSLRCAQHCNSIGDFHSIEDHLSCTSLGMRI